MSGLSAITSRVLGAYTSAQQEVIGVIGLYTSLISYVIGKGKKASAIASVTPVAAAPVVVSAAGDRLAGIADPDLRKLLEEVPEFVEYIGTD